MVEVACTKSHTGLCKLSGCNKVQRRYVYGLFDIRLWTIFYIGHSVYAYQRLREHIQGAELGRYDKSNYIWHMIKDEIDPILIVLDWVFLFLKVRLFLTLSEPAC